MAGCSSFKFFITDMTQVRLHPLNDWECGGFGKCLEVSLHGLQQRRRCLPDPLLHLHVRRWHQRHPHRDNNGTVLGHGHSSRILQVGRNKLINLCKENFCYVDVTKFPFQLRPTVQGCWYCSSVQRGVHHLLLQRDHRLDCLLLRSLLRLHPPLDWVRQQRS